MPTFFVVTLLTTSKKNWSLQSEFWLSQSDFPPPYQALGRWLTSPKEKQEKNPGKSGLRFRYMVCKYALPLTHTVLSVLKVTGYSLLINYS